MEVCQREVLYSVLTHAKVIILWSRLVLLHFFKTVRIVFEQKYKRTILKAYFLRKSTM